MGQYYKALLIEESGRGSDYYEPDFRKLTEHSWIGNDFLEAICSEIFDKPKRVVWVGDYAAKKLYSPLKNNEGVIIHKKGWYAETESLVNNLSEKEVVCFYKKTWENKKEQSQLSQNCLDIRGSYVVNHTKSLYLDGREYYESSKFDWSTPEDFEADYWCAHPLSLLTAIGNGLGGGDFYGKGRRHIGEWAGDLISVSKTIPQDYKKFSVIFDEREEESLEANNE